MPDHVAEQIAAKLQSRLEWLKSSQTGYTTVLLDVRRPLPYETPENHGVHLYCELSQLDPERNEDLDAAMNPPVLGWSQPFYAQVTFAPSDQSTSVDAQGNAIIKDVTRALFQDPDEAGAYEDTLGGVVLGIDLLAPEFIDATEESPDVLAIGVTCHYQTYENDPSQQP